MPQLGTMDAVHFYKWTDEMYPDVQYMLDEGSLWV